MNANKEHAHKLLHQQFKKGEKAAPAARKVNEFLGADAFLVKRNSEIWSSADEEQMGGTPSD